ncbi:hypothetical protein HDU67_005807, partial [Dinochytrium kinnereticum]
EAMTELVNVPKYLRFYDIKSKNISIDGPFPPLTIRLTEARPNTIWEDGYVSSPLDLHNESSDPDMLLDEQLLEILSKLFLRQLHRFNKAQFESPGHLVDNESFAEKPAILGGILRWLTFLVIENVIKRISFSVLTDTVVMLGISRTFSATNHGTMQWSFHMRYK